MADRTVESIRAELNHPVIDADGHILEFLPEVLPYIREQLSADAFTRYTGGMSPREIIVGLGAAADRTQTREPVVTWWGTPAANTRDLATATIPRLMHERLPEFGVDFAVLYPTNAVGSAGIDDDEVRVGVCRGFNEYYAAEYGPYADRLTVAAIVPMHTPEEAIASLEHAASLGLKVVAIPEGVWRPIPRPGTSKSTWLIPEQRWWFDTFGLDAAYDYDPVWRKVEELELTLTCHANMGRPAPFIRTSISSMAANHLGSHENRVRPVLKSLFFGGITRRFPNLRFAVLECGVGWVPGVFNGIVELWERRNIDALRSQLDPQLIDFELFEDLVRRYAPHWAERAGSELPQRLRGHPNPGEPPQRGLDDFEALQVTSKRDFLDLFVDRFYFGCEADDATVPLAFSEANKLGAQFKPLFSSDIGHWDVADMAGVLPEAYKIRARGFVTAEQFERFMFANAFELYTSARPNFFDGTAIADRVATPASS